MKDFALYDLPLCWILYLRRKTFSITSSKMNFLIPKDQFGLDVHNILSVRE